MMDGDNFVVLASKRGAPEHPDWYYNLVANPQVQVELGIEKFETLATIVSEPERTTLYEKMSEVYSWNKEFQQNTTRVIPVIVLTQES